MQGHGNVAEESTEGPKEGDATLADGEMNPVVEESGSEIASDRNDKYCRDSSVADIVVGFDLESVSAVALR